MLAPHTYQWDAEGRVASVDGGSTWSFTYNALGDRVQWAYSGGADQHFFDPEGNWLGNAGSYSLVTFGGRYFALYLGGNTLFNHVNALDSASMRTLQSGAEAEDILFYPWGDVWEVQGGGGYNFANIPYRDVTTTTDITTARFSSPNFGRWLSPDPIGVKAVKLNDPQTWNMYAYVRNSPTTLTDPTGLNWEAGIQCGGNDTSPCEGGFPPCVMSSDKSCGEGGPWHQQQEPVEPSFPREFGCAIPGAICGNPQEAQTQQPDAPAPSGTDPDFPFGLVLKTASDFSAGAGDVLSLGTTYLARKYIFDSDQVVDKGSGAYIAGAVTGAAIGAAIGATGAAVANGKNGALFGRGGGLFNRGAVRFGWGWKGSAKAGRDVIRLAIGAARGTSWWSHIPFYYP